MNKLLLSSKRRSVLLLALCGGIASAPVSAQVRPLGMVPAAKPPSVQPKGGKPALAKPLGTKPVAGKPKPSADTPVPGDVNYAADPLAARVAPAPVAMPLAPAVWDVADAQQLLRYIEQVGVEGLNPGDYDPAGLAAAIQSSDLSALSSAATQRFDALSSDLALGHVKKPARVDWYVVDNDLNAAKQDALLRSALAAHDLTAALNGLLPTHPQYAALKAALAAMPESDPAARDRIRLNLDRWRWLPRDLGSKYVIVNVPGFHATLVQDGVNRWKQRAIAGKLTTPTPQLSALATGVILNPWWEVPKSIEHEAAGKKGFVPVIGPDGEIQRWRQPPGPTNALGQIKFVMPNSKAIYLHDTNARSRFNDNVRALSHGCIRTEHILDLASQLLGDDQGAWTSDRIQAALASEKSVQANFVKPVPVYIVYFSTAALNDGRIVDYKDLYGRDPKAMAALHMKDGGASLLPPKPPADPKPKPPEVATR